MRSISTHCRATTPPKSTPGRPRSKPHCRKLPILTEVNLDQQQKGLEADLVIDRATAARLGLTMSQIDNTLYDAFGQRQVSVIYAARNQYHVIMEVAPEFWQNPQTLNDIYISTSGGSVSGTQATQPLAGTVSGKKTAGANAAATAAKIAGNPARNAANNALANTGRGVTSTGAPVSTAAETMVPLSAVAHFAPGNTPLAVNHQNLFVASTISFNLAPGVSLSDAQAGDRECRARELDMPSSVRGSFQGTAKVFQQSLANEPLLIAAALVTVYIVLGVLYESYVHPITILSTLPSAGVGAILALMLTGTEFDIIGLIGVILLIGIVKKNAIMMIDFALAAERSDGLSSREAIYQACLKRFPSDHDDDNGGDARRPAIGDRVRRGRGAAPAIGHFDRRRADRQPGADPLHDPGNLSLSRPFPPVGEPQLARLRPPFRLAPRRRTGRMRERGG